MLKRSFVIGTFSIVLAISAADVVFGQDYPNKPIRIVTNPVGSSIDFPARLIAQGIAGPLGQRVIIDNRPPGVTQAQIVSKASPDGYTLLAAGTSLWVGPHFLNDAPYDPVKEFSPISLTNSSPNVLVVHPSLPVKSIKELIALTKARPGELNYATGATGTTAHLATELFKFMAGVNMVRISYTSSSQEKADLIGGHVQLSIAGVAGVAPYIKSGKLRALAVTSAEPTVLMPGLPTIAASGLPGYEAVQRQGIFAPAKTPAPIIHRLNQEVVRILNMPDTKEKFLSVGLEPVGSSAEDFAATVKSEIIRTGKLINSIGLRIE